MPKLNGREQEALERALCSAFPSLNDLERMMRYRLDKNLQAIAMGDNLRVVVFRLIQAAQAQGWIYLLLSGARKDNPGNVDLEAFCQEIGLCPQSPLGPELEKIIKQENSFHDAHSWQKAMGELVNQVCRVEIKGSLGERTYGTGFLVAPELLLTNYHVMKSIIEQHCIARANRPSVALQEVLFCFDYTVLTKEVTIHPGTVYRLASENWLVDWSPPSEWDRVRPPKENDPSPNELDYALLRLEGTPGNDPVGAGHGKGTQIRGWVKVLDRRHEFRPDSAILILQHPKGDSLKLALDTNAAPAINANGTRITYRTNTEPGSSGSPCFNMNWELIALHHAGDPDSFAPEYNQGIPMKAILDLLEQRGKKHLICSGELGRGGRDLQLIGLKAILRDANIPWPDILRYYKQELRSGALIERNPEIGDLDSLIENLLCMPIQEPEHRWPLLSFVGSLANHVSDDRIKTRLLDWADIVSEHFFPNVDSGQRETTVRESFERRVMSASECLFVSVIVFQLAKVREPKQYLVTTLCWLRDGNYFAVGSRAKLAWDQIPQSIMESLKKLDDNGYNKAGATIEFFLPLRLLWHDVDQLSLPEPGKSVKLGFRYPVTVRCSERARYSQSYDIIREKWDKLAKCCDAVAKSQFSRTVSVAELCDHPKLYYEWISSDHACMVITSFPKASDDAREVLGSIIGGAIPIALWLRPGKLADQQEADNTITELVDKCELLKLREEVHLLRKEATLAADSHPGNHISLMWDDPSRIPPTCFLQAV